MLLEAYCRAGERAKALELQRELLAESRPALPEEGPELAGLLAHVGRCLILVEEWAEAETVLSECVLLMEKGQPDHWSTFDMKFGLGTAVLRQQRYPEAEALLLESLRGMQARVSAIPVQSRNRLLENQQSLVALYTAWDAVEPNAGHAAQAAEWSAELEAAQR